MTLPTLTRGIGFREDGLSATPWNNPFQTANVSAAVPTSDGDIVSDTVTFTSAVNTNNGGVGFAVSGSPSTTTYPKVIVRHKDQGLGSNPDFYFKLVYGDSTSDIFALAKGTALTVETFSLTTGKTLSNIYFYLQANASLTGAFTCSLDFAFIFKETLTLPSVTRATPVPAKIYLVKIPVLLKEGDVLQHIGSSSPEFQLGGSLITTSQYSADDWNRVLDGLRLEQATIQADGNPTWQWFNHDLWQRKVMIGDYVPIDVPGRTRNTMNDYSLRLVEWDTISQTASAINAIQ